MSEDIIKQILELSEISEDINNFITEGQYLNPEAEGDVNLTDILLRCRLILLDDLKGFGIVPNDPELIFDGYKSDVVGLMVEIFDEVLLKEIMTSLKEDEVLELKEILKNQFDVDREFGLDMVAGFILKLHPNNPKFKKMKYYSHDFQVEPLFYTRLFTLIENTIQYDKESIDDNILLVAYLEFKYKHIQNVRKAADFFLTLDFNPPIRQVELRSRLSMHDSDLIYGDSLREYSLNWQLSKNPKIDPVLMENMELVESKHHHQKRHHLEFYVGKEAEMDNTDKVEILSDIYSGQETKDAYIFDVIHKFSTINCSPTIKDELIQLARKLDLW